MKVVFLSLLGVASGLQMWGNGVTLEHNMLYPSWSDGTRLSRACVGSSTRRTFTVQNDGTAPINLGTVNVVMDGGGNAFSASSLPTDTLQPGAEVDFVVTFAPSEAGQPWATVTVTSDDPDFVWGIAAEAVAPLIEVQLQSDGRPVDNLDFGIVDASNVQTVMDVYALNRETCETTAEEITITQDGDAFKLLTIDGEDFGTFGGLPTALVSNQDRLFFRVSFEGGPLRTSGDYSSEIVVKTAGDASYTFTTTATIEALEIPCNFVNDISAGSVHVEGSGYVLESSMPCTYEGVTLTSSSGMYPFRVVKNDMTVDLSVWPTQVVTGGATFKWIPQVSCAMVGCTTLAWYDLSAPVAQSCYSGGLTAGDGCFCDDACVNFKDCCYDYQVACKASVGVSYGNSELSALMA